MHDQISHFHRSFGERDCHPSSISLFRLGIDRIDVREHLMSQDVIYAGGGSMVNLIAIWRAHGLDEILREAWEEGILICGQSAGAMCWFEHGITSSSGEPAPAEGLGLLPGSACVHYLSEPQRRKRFMEEIGAGRMPAGIGMEDQTGALFEGGRMAESIVAREGAAVWSVEPATTGGLAREEQLDSRRSRTSARRPQTLSSEILEFRETLARDCSTAPAGRRQAGLGGAEPMLGGEVGSRPRPTSVDVVVRVDADDLQRAVALLANRAGLRRDDDDLAGRLNLGLADREGPDLRGR